MRERLTLPLILLLGALAGACGGDDSESRRTTPTWQPRERIPVVGVHWWGEPVEETCEDTMDCEDGRRCQLVRLSSCQAGCPTGEDVRICVPRDWEGDVALQYPPPEPEDDGE